MLIGIISIFPKIFKSIIAYGITKKAIQKDLVTLKFWNPRNFSKKKIIE